MARLESVQVPLGACVPSSAAPVTTVTSRHSALVLSLTGSPPCAFLPYSSAELKL